MAKPIVNKPMYNYKIKAIKYWFLSLYIYAGNFMKIETEKLARKPLKDYDTNHDGKIDATEASVFKEDCSKLYACAYGVDSKQYKNLSQRLAQTTILFKNMQASGELATNSDYENHKYKIYLSTKMNKEKLNDNKMTLTDMAGILIHEEEHIQQNQSVYDQVRSKHSKQRAKDAISYARNGNTETFAEIERMNFYKQLGTFSFADKNETYKKYVEESNKIDVDPNKDPKNFFEKFNFAEFGKVVEKRYNTMEFDDKRDNYGMKNLLFE